MTVWVAHKGNNKDYSKALRYGYPIRSVFPISVMPDHTEAVRVRLFGKAYAALSDFNQEHDYLLLAGAPEAIAFCAAILLSRYPSIKTLKWDRENQYYYPIDMSLERLTHGHERKGYSEQSAF
jgi:hypothetical protein